MAADVCSYGPEGTERSMWACAGNANYELIDLGPTDNTLITFGYPLTLSGQYGGTPIVYASCNDDAASEWCGGVLPLPAQACTKDCTFQLCRKMVTDFKKHIDETNTDDSEEFAKAYHAFLQYIDEHTHDCQVAILEELNCTDFRSQSACDSASAIGQCTIPNLTLWSDYFEDYVFRGECEINDWK